MYSRIVKTTDTLRCAIALPVQCVNLHSDGQLPIHLLRHSPTNTPVLAQPPRRAPAVGAWLPVIVQVLDRTRHNPNDGVISLCALVGTTYAGERRCEMSAVIVLNTDNTALHTVSVQHAIRMLVREVAIVEEAHEDRRIGPYPWPLVLRLVRYVKTTFLYARTPAWSKRGVLRRDHHRCAYCQGPADTVDHLLPQSRGGTNSWKNTVAACTRCNNRKANRTPTEAGMSLAWKPSVPTWREAYHRRN